MFYIIQNCTPGRVLSTIQEALHKTFLRAGGGEMIFDRKNISLLFRIHTFLFREECFLD